MDRRKTYEILYDILPEEIDAALAQDKSDGAAPHQEGVMDGKTIVEAWQREAYYRTPVFSPDMALLSKHIDAALAQAKSDGAANATSTCEVLMQAAVEKAKKEQEALIAALNGTVRQAILRAMAQSQDEILFALAAVITDARARP